MPRLPQLSASQLARILQKTGFSFIRQSGSHMLFFHPDGKSTLVPSHAGEKIDRGLLNKIIKKDLHMERGKFLRLLR